METRRRLTPAQVIARDKNRDKVGPKAAGLPFSAQVDGPNGPVACKLVDNKDGTWKGTYTAKDWGDHTVTVKYENDNVGDSPFSVFVAPDISAENTICRGPGLEDGIKDSQPTYFGEFCALCRYCPGTVCLY